MRSTSSRFFKEWNLMASDSSDYPEAPDRLEAFAPSARKSKHGEKRATYQDVLDAPPNRVAEVLGGALHTRPKPASPHLRAASRLGVRLGDPFDSDQGDPGGWWILDEPELHLSEDIVVPDLSGWRRENMPELADTPYFSQPPDWVCEVLSPSTRALDEGPKQQIYAREGVAHLWLVDPKARSLAAFALRGRRYALLRKLVGDADASLPPFDAITFSLADLWLPPGNT